MRRLKFTHFKRGRYKNLKDTYAEEDWHFEDVYRPSLVTTNLFIKIILSCKPFPLLYLWRLLSNNMNILCNGDYVLFVHLIFTIP